MSDFIIHFIVIMVSALVATTGISVMFCIEKRVLPWGLLAALLCCAGYEVTLMLGGGLLLASMIGSALAATFSDVMAHWLKTPATVLIIPGIVALVPGGKLYYTMLGAVRSDMICFRKTARRLFCAPRALPSVWLR
jgi:uncharacterized membrane protein YjjB (DUF3815 family)